MRQLASIFALAALLSACGGTSERYDHYDTRRDEPRLREFHVIDTYGTNTEFDSEDLALSPVVNRGEFEVFWDVSSSRDYFIELRFNLEPTTDQSRLISSELCGPFFYCDNHPYQFCDYTNALELRCENSEGTEIQGAYVGDLLPRIPEDGWLILQVCDTAFVYCEFDALPVSME